METLEKAKFVPKEKAVEVVNKVFDKCYADLEPLGRRPINAKDMKRAYNERYLCENWKSNKNGSKRKTKLWN